MSAYASHTETMLRSTSGSPAFTSGLAANLDSKPVLSASRSRDTDTGLGQFTKPFVIHPHAGSPHQKSTTLTPVRIVSRCQLPLAFLDTAADEHFPANCLFSAHIDVLEHDGEEQEKDSQPAPLLIAWQEPEQLLYAIERVRTRVYSVCRLARWLRERELENLKDVLSLQPSTLSAKDITPGEPWWQTITIQTQPLPQPTKRIRMSMMRPKLAADDPAVCKLSGMDMEMGAHPLDPTPAQPPPQEQLDSLAQQYLDAVYLSKTSLAYFAKGPITRIRNTFTSPNEGAPPTVALVTFLRSMLLSHKASEKKYHEKLPAIIKTIPPDMLSDDETAPKAEKVSKSKKKWKLSRDGVYPQEENMVKKWWKSNTFTENVGQETMDQRVKRRVGDLRVRETLAQMILMLEIVALEALASKPPTEGPNTEEAQPQDESQLPIKKRKKKFEDIGLQLDLLLDKLSIWHATEEDGIMDFDSKAPRQKHNSDKAGPDGANDRLRGFCVEVIIPFYMNRLPEQALMINKKLGGPANTTPQKRKAMRPPMASRKSGVKEPEAKKSRRSLARVATDTTGRTGTRPARSLSRSATDSSLLKNIKREGSEVPMSAIPFQRSPSRGARQSMSQIRHLQGREMDLTTTSAAATAKLKQKQRVEEDLKDAITALKKPNRDLAAGSYVADIERRGLGSSSGPRGRKPTNTVRKVVRDVQVSATPRVGRRTKNMIEQTPRRDEGNPFVVGSAPQVSDFNIPSSAVRPTSVAVPDSTQRNAAGRGAAAGGIAETPSKGPSTSIFMLGPARRTIFDTPLKASKSRAHDDIVTAPVFETPVKGNGSLQAKAVSMSPTGVFATPTKAASVPIVEDSPGGRRGNRQDQEGELSIYDALGWDDEEESG